MKYLQDSVGFNIGRGKIATPFNALGINTDIDIAAAEAINNLGATPYYPATAKTVVIVGADAADRGWYQAVLTLTGNLSDTDQVEMNGKTYTAQTVLTDVDGNFLIGATASDTIDNLIAANTLGAGSGTLYAASTTAHGTVTCTAGAGDTMIARENTQGTGAAYTATETSATASWDVATFVAGTGVQTATIEGYTVVNSEWVRDSETVVLDGLVSVNSSKQFIRVNRVRANTLGSNLSAEGLITFKDGANFFAQINAGEVESSLAGWSAGHREELVINKFTAGLGSVTGSGYVKGKAQEVEGASAGVKYDYGFIGIADTGKTGGEYKFDNPLSIPGPCDFYIEATVLVDNTTVGGTVHGCVIGG